MAARISQSDSINNSYSASYHPGNDSNLPNSEIPAGNASNQVEAEWIEQYEPGVYITLATLRDGTRYLKRGLFSRRRFGEHQAELWWLENREKVYKRYKIRVSSDQSSVSCQAAGQRHEDAFAVKVFNR